MKTKEITLRSYPWVELYYFCEKILKITAKKNNRVFLKTKKGYYLNCELSFLVFHLTRVFVPFRGEDMFFPRKCEYGFKQYAICGTFKKKELPEVKRGLIYIAKTCQGLLRDLRKDLKKRGSR